MKKFYKVSFQYSEYTYCANIAHADSLQDVEKHYSKYAWSKITEAADYDVEEAKTKGMPIIEIESTQEPEEQSQETTTEEKENGTMRKTYKQLISEAMEILENDDEIFCDMVNELDSWNGYADGFRCYYMEDLDKLFCGVSLREFLDKIGRDFNHNDRFFVDTIYGLESTDSMADTYRDNVSTGELLDEIIDKQNHIYFNDSDFEELIDSIVNYSEEEDDDTETAGSLDTIRDRMIDGFNGIAAAATAGTPEPVNA